MVSCLADQNLCGAARIARSSELVLWKGHGVDGFQLDVEVARGIKSALIALQLELSSIKRDAQSLKAVGGMGTLQSGLDLADKFSKKAIGGEDSLEKSLDSHIAVVKEMRAYFQACIDRYESVDGENAATHAKFEIPG